MLNPAFGSQRSTAVALPTVRDILEHYKNTLVGTQAMIALITLVALMKTHRVIAALAFFATMQIGAVLGAVWAARLKNKIEAARWKAPQ